MHLDFHLPIRVTRQTALEKLAILDRLVRRNARQPPGEAFEFAGLGQLAIQARRTDFQNVMRSGNQILNVQQHAQLLAHGLAIAVADAFGLIDEDPQKPLLAHFPFDVDNFDSGRMRGPFRRVADAFYFQGLASPGQEPTPGADCQQKSGLAPTRKCDRFQPSKV